MSNDCTSDPRKQNVSGSNPGSQRNGSSALEINLSEESLNIFNPNAALAAVQTFNELNKTANMIFGVDARWFRAVPQQRSKDVIFQEYTLSCVEEEPICIKVLAPEGTFAESNYQYDLMGLEYQIPQEIHIDKGYWEEKAGFGTAPQRKDIVYLPLPNKLYQVESAYLKRGFMEQETTWVVNLKKYQPEASRRESDALKETIDKYTVSEDELFGEIIDKEVEKITDDKQMSPFNSTSEDKYKAFDPNLQIISGNIDIYGIIAAQSFYNLETSELFNAVTYNASDNIATSDDRAVTAWMLQKSTNVKQYEVIGIQKDSTLTYPANYKIRIKSTKRFNIDDTFVISRPGALNFYAKVIDDNEAVNGTYYCQIDQDVENYLTSVKFDWASTKNYKMKIKNPVTVIDGINETDTGFKVSIIANQYIRIIYGTQKHVACLSERLEDDKWYGVVVNIGNTWGQYNVYVWEEHPNDRDAKLRIKFYDTLNFTPEQTTVQTYTLDKSYSYITNIRLFRTTIEEEKQANELLSYFTKDADQAIILDNADIKFNNPYISKQR